MESELDQYLADEFVKTEHFGYIARKYIDRIWRNDEDGRIFVHTTSGDYALAPLEKK